MSTEYPLETTYGRPRSQRFNPSWLPRNRTINCSSFETNPKRFDRPARHSKMFPLSLRMPSPLWTCGFPKAPPSSSSATTAPTFCGSGSASNSFWTAGANATNFLKGFLHVVRDGDQFAGAAKNFDFRVNALLEAIQFLRRGAVFTPGVVVGLNLDFPQRKYAVSRKNSHLFTSPGGIQPLAQVLLRLGDRECFHTNLIAPPYRSVNAPL